MVRLSNFRETHDYRVCNGTDDENKACRQRRADEFSGIDMRDVLLYRISNISNNYRFRRQQL